MAQSDFERYLNDEREVWRPHILGEVKMAGGPPNKESIMGAWRDLNKAEALLELIDNSIDAWIRRKNKYAKHTSKTLQIYIDLDESANKIVYEDNAGGVIEDQLPNLVIPGLSETSDTEATIGSYKTGGKKAIFKLAIEANIETYYRDPDEVLDEAYGIHLDKNWIQDSEEYRFPYYPIKNKSDILKGHTVYTFRLREHGWDSNIVEQIVNEIRRTYTLLMVRNPNIEIYFNNRLTPLAPLEEFYTFSGAFNQKIDVRPQKAVFKTQLDWKGKPYAIDIEVVIGCRTTTAGQKGEDRWGIDIYGNNRLFVHHNQDETFKWFELPTANSGKLVRGFINIHGPNVFMPWDTHKRHLNYDRDIIGVLKSKPIRDLFASWKEAYTAIAALEEIKETIKHKFEPWKKQGDINIAFSNDIQLPKKQRGWTLPPTIHKPKVSSPKSAIGSKQIPVSFKVTQAEFRRLCTTYGVSSSNGETQARKEIGDAIKAAVLNVR